MNEPVVIQALAQLGAAGILAIAVVSLFNRLIELQRDFRMYLINQNAMLREENKMLLLALTNLIPGFSDTYAKIRTGVETKIE